MSSYELLTPDAENVVTFRKSVYDDDGNALALDAVDVVQTNLQVHDPPATPAWLSYATSTENTNEGPSGNRTYLHIDFTIDVDNLADNDLQFIRIRANDGTNENAQVFRFMKGNLQMSDLSGCVAWVKPEMEDPRPADNSNYDTPTNFGTAAGFSATNCRYRRNLAMSTDGVAVEDGIVHNGPLLSTTNDQQAYSAFVVAINEDDYHQYFLRQSGGSKDMGLRWHNGRIEYEKETPGGENSEIAASSVPQGAFGLIEYHKRPDGTIYVFENGVLKITTSDAEIFSAGDFVFMDSPTFETFLMEAALFEADLTNAQVEAIRKRLYQSYPDLNMQALAAAQFS